MCEKNRFLTPRGFYPRIEMSERPRAIPGGKMTKMTSLGQKKDIFAKNWGLEGATVGGTRGCGWPKWAKNGRKIDFLKLFQKRVPMTGNRFLGL